MNMIKIAKVLLRPISNTEYEQKVIQLSRRPNASEIKLVQECTLRRIFEKKKERR